MRRGNALRTFALVTLLLPGLAIAAPTAGECGHCDRGVPCATMAAPEPVAEAHSCCNGESVEKPALSTPASFGAEACDCGREAPVATAVVEASAPAKASADGFRPEFLSGDVSRLTAAFAGRRTPAPPPHPLIFLVDCVFLT